MSRNNFDIRLDNNILSKKNTFNFIYTKEFNQSIKNIALLKLYVRVIHTIITSFYICNCNWNFVSKYRCIIRCSVRTEIMSEVIKAYVCYYNDCCFGAVRFIAPNLLLLRHREPTDALLLTRIPVTDSLAPLNYIFCYTLRFLVGI